MRSGNVEALFDHIGSEVCLLCRLAVRCLHAALFLFICFEPRMVVYGVNAGVLIWLKASPVGIIVSMGCLCYFNICAMRSSSLSLGRRRDSCFVATAISGWMINPPIIILWRGWAI